MEYSRQTIASAVQKKLSTAMKDEITFLVRRYRMPSDVASNLIVLCLSQQDDHARSHSQGGWSPSSSESESEHDRKIEYLCRIHGMVYSDAERVCLLGNELRNQQLRSLRRQGGFSHSDRAHSVAPPSSASVATAVPVVADADVGMLQAVDRLCEKLKLLRPRIDSPALSACSSSTAATAARGGWRGHGLRSSAEAGEGAGGRVVTLARHLSTGGGLPDGVFAIDGDDHSYQLQLQAILLDGDGRGGAHHQLLPPGRGHGTPGQEAKRARLDAVAAVSAGGTATGAAASAVAAVGPASANRRSPRSHSMIIGRDVRACDAGSAAGPAASSSSACDHADQPSQPHHDHHLRHKPAGTGQGFPATCTVTNSDAGHAGDGTSGVLPRGSSRKRPRRAATDHGVGAIADTGDDGLDAELEDDDRDDADAAAGAPHG